MGPVFFDSTTLTANQLVDVINAADWIYRRLPWPAVLKIGMIHDGAAGGVGATIILGSDTQVGPDMPVSAGGTAGVFPDQSNSFIELLGAAGDLVKIQYRELDGVATTDVMTEVRLFPQV